MANQVRVGEVAELPPGKGKVVELGGRQVTIYNIEGRFHATSTRAPHPSEPSTVDCTQHGLVFDVFAEDSPASLRADERCAVTVRDGVLWLTLHD